MTTLELLEQINEHNKVLAEGINLNAVTIEKLLSTCVSLTTDVEILKRKAEELEPPERLPESEKDA